MATISVTVQMSGGMELLFANEPTHALTLPRFYLPASSTLASPAPPDPPAPVAADEEGATETDVRFLVWWLREYLLEDRQRPELFSQGETVRPGILVLINSTDWELEGELDYVLEDGDEVVFISTLHGG
ncbi:hypothetical protein Rhopal_000226-T1 [Rhodotorula paludigena]|uniref:Ubiquitin-related modifier 1 n=1 Tax=Rhodotorula paludigena TaxID=86838 RepID=A0AAV5GF69_9BASI|nr:hypothetical protein Rhopal_000226-T1 [Rhodotorula paludigena]